jgi:hypothetical protein
LTPIGYSAEIALLRERTYRAFPLQPRPSVRLSDAVTRDNWGHPPSDWPAETWRDWTEIPSDLLKRAECLLTYFDDEELTYFLPRFVIELLDDAERNPDRFSLPAESFVYHVNAWRKRNYSELQLTAEQKKLLEDMYIFAQEFSDLRWLAP